MSAATKQENDEKFNNINKTITEYFSVLRKKITRKEYVEIY